MEKTTSTTSIVISKTHTPVMKLDKASAPSTIITAQCKPLSEKFTTPTILRTITRSCTQNRSLDDCAYKMGWKKSKVNYWLHQCQYNQENVPEEIIQQFLNLAHGYNKLTMADVAKMCGFTPKTMKQLRKERAALRGAARAKAIKAAGAPSYVEEPMNKLGAPGFEPFTTL